MTAHPKGIAALARPHRAQGQRAARGLLALSAAILMSGGLLHARAYPRAVAVAGGSTLPTFFANAFKGLWLIDVAWQVTLAAVFVLVALRPIGAAKWMVVLLALLPAATASILYFFFGNFVAAHLQSAAAAVTLTAGLLLREEEGASR